MAKKRQLTRLPFPDMPVIDGVTLGVGFSGLNYKNRNDMLLAQLAPGTNIAGVLTRSQTAAAPVRWCRQALKGGKARAILVNAGNANAFTGKQGADTVKATVDRAAKLVGCARNQVFIASTGRIGVQLTGDALAKRLPGMQRSGRPDKWRAAAEAIMTTDTVPKGATRQAEIAGAGVTINGIGKGTTMIAPDMATTLNFVFTDANLSAAVLQKLLNRAVNRTYNCITVEGDTSTNDTLLLCATGAAKHARITDANDPRLREFAAALEAVMRDVCHAIVRDVAGASQFVAVTVKGAASALAARKIGLSVASSALFKTGVRARDPWGRLIMAVGKSGQKANRDKLCLETGGIAVASEGYLRDDFDRDAVKKILSSESIELTVDVGVGRGQATVWTCDTSPAYAG